MKIIGLTGGSGAGKSLAASIFRKNGIPVVDADAVYHDILQSQNPCTEELTLAFGSSILMPSGGVDRRKLREAVLRRENTSALLHTLNTITHKYIMAKTEELLQSHANEGAQIALLDAPLLFEAGAERICDTVIGVLAERDLRLARIMKRDGISTNDATTRLNAQKDDTFFLEQCDVIFYNNGSPADLERQICEFLTKYVVKS